jgi:RNA polymerase sigma-54 factor
MALELRQHLKLSQQLVMTPQLQQAIKLLQLSRLELAATVQQEIEQNPVLEEMSASQDSDSDFEADQKAGQIETAQERPETEFTNEVRMNENQNTLSEINWQDYANEYEYNAPSFVGKGDSDLPSRLDIVSKKPNLQSHLHWQLRLSDLSEEDKETGMFIIGNLDKDGFLKIEVEDIMAETDCDEKNAVKILRQIQAMDPPGVGARNVQESLQLQLDYLGLSNSLASIMARDHLSSLETKNYAAIAKATGKPIKDVLAAIKIIVNLDPFPGRLYSDEEPQYIIPDVYVQKLGDEYVILLNDEGLPRLRVNSYYKEILKNQTPASNDTKEYIQEKLRSAAWLIKSIQQRQRTIYRVVESLVKFQRDFFDKGVAYLRPLILRDVAEDMEMHESTISRVTSNKYVHTPQGTFELKYFFNSAIEQKGGDDLSSESIKQRIRGIIQKEDHEKPLSDNAIAEIFKKEDIKLARRTVAKYREQLCVLPSKMRKKPKLV